MTEIELRKNKNGMVMLILLIVLYVLAIMATVIGAGIENYILVALGVIYISLGWIFFLGLKVLKPQEALVLTLFGNYIGTLKGEGFTAHVGEGDTVTPDTLLLSVDLDAVRPKVPSLVTPVVFTNLGDKAIELKKTGSVTHGEASILEIK